MKNKYKKVYSLAHKSGYRNYTVRDLLDLKGKKKLTQINVVSPEEAERLYNYLLVKKGHVRRGYSDGKKFQS